ncbi:MAG: hypothetical protein WC364_14405, partial [Eubacteriales bacterium]
MKNVALILAVMLMLGGICFGVYGDTTQLWSKTNGVLVPSDPLSIAKRVSGTYTAYSAIDGYSPAFDSPLFMNYTRAFATNTIPVGIIGKVNNTGSAAAGAGHAVGVLGWGTDTAAGVFPTIGVEGKADVTGTANQGTGVLGQGLFQGSSFTSIVTAVNATSKITTDGTTPLAQGTAFAFYAPPISGGAAKYGLFVSDQAVITQNGNLNKYVQLIHDGTDANVTSSSGDLNLNAPAGSKIVANRLVNATGFEVNGTGLHGSNVVAVYSSQSSATIQALIDAYEAIPGWTAANPLVIRFMPGSYTALDLTLGNYTIVDADDPGTVLAGEITATGTTGTYVYLWDHPSGVYPASLTLTNATEI